MMDGEVQAAARLRKDIKSLPGLAAVVNEHAAIIMYSYYFVTTCYSMFLHYTWCFCLFDNF